MHFARSANAVEWRPSSWPAIEPVADSVDSVAQASAILIERARVLSDPPAVALLGQDRVQWLLRGASDPAALLWADAACLIEVVEGRVTVLGALLAGAARSEAVAPAWEWTRRQAILHEGPDSVVSQLPQGGKAPRGLRGTLLPTMAQVMRDQIRIHDYQESHQSEIHVRWSTSSGDQATTRASNGIYEVCRGPLAGKPLELRLDDRDLTRVIRRETRITDLVLEGRVVLDGDLEVVNSLPAVQF